jgi:protein CpxP
MNAMQRISRRALAASVVGAGLFAATLALPAAAQHRGHQHRDQFFAHFAEVKSQLNLDASQQALWDSAVAAGKAAREAGRARRDTIRQVVTEEAANPKPDLARIAAASDKVRDSATTDRRAVRDQWLALYATFRTDQYAVVQTMLTNRLSRMDSFHERMKKRFGHQ